MDWTNKTTNNRCLWSNSVSTGILLVSDNAHHFSVKPSRVMAGRAALADVPFCCEVGALQLVTGLYWHVTRGWLEMFPSTSQTPVTRDNKVFLYKLKFCCWNWRHHHLVLRGRDSAVGITTRYGLDGPGIESRWGRNFPHPSRPALGITQPPIKWVPGLSRG